MSFLNYLISLPYQKYNDQLTNFQFFEKVMNRIFSLIFVKNKGEDLQSVIDDKGEFKQNSKFKEKKTLTE